MDGLRPDLVRGEVAELRHRLNQISTKDLRSRLAAVEGRLDAGYVYGGQVVYTSSDTFSKADYPGLRAVRVKCQGAGGGGGGVAATGAGERAVSAGGNGGGYAEKFILVDDLSGDETVTVGAGGSGGPAGNNAGSSGGDSSFGSHCVGEGGIGGSGGFLSNVSTFTGESGSSTLAGGTGDLVIRGGGAGVGFSFGTGIRQGHNSQGGGSHLGAATNVTRQGGNTTGSNGQGSDGIPYGGGASGLISRDNALATAGKKGADGIVLVELYY